MSPSTPGAPPARTSTHGRGNWRSLVISMGIVLLVVLVWLAFMPRPAGFERPAVDVGSSARAVHDETGWTVLVPRLGEPWKPTSVTFGPADQGVRTWHVGYADTTDDSVYVGVEETRASGDALDAWIVDQVKHGSRQGSTDVAGATWERYVASGERPRHSIVRRDAGGGTAVVVTGLASFEQLRAVAATLTPYAPEAGSAAPSASSPPSP